MKTITVMIADDHPVVRKAIKNIFRKKPDIIFSGEANNGIELMALIEKAVPDIALIDLEMPEMNGYHAMAEIHTRYPEIKLIAFSGFLDETNQQRAISAGAYATISKTESTEKYIEALETVLKGKNFHSKTGSDFYVAPLEIKQNALLSLREKQILKQIAEGKTSRQISEIYNISQWTVNKHRSNIKEKLGLKNLSEIIRYAIDN